MTKLLTAAAVIAGLLALSACDLYGPPLPSQEHQGNNTYIGAPGNFAP